MNRPPNTALQRTRSAPLRSPLSFKPLGALKVLRGASILMLFVAGIVGSGDAGAESKEGLVRARIINFGLYRDTHDPTAGLPRELERQTTTIPACLKTEFGYQLRIRGLSPHSEVRFKKVVKTPPIHKPDGTVSTGYEKIQTTQAWTDGSAFTHQGYGIDYPYEAVSGEWTIEFWYGSQRLATKTFTLVPCKTP